MRPGDLRVEQMFCVPLPGGDDPAAAGAALAAALAERKLTKSPALVALARSQVELLGKLDHAALLDRYR